MKLRNNMFGMIHFIHKLGMYIMCLARLTLLNSEQFTKHKISVIMIDYDDYTLNMDKKNDTMIEYKFRIMLGMTHKYSLGLGSNLKIYYFWW